MTGSNRIRWYQRWDGARTDKNRCYQVTCPLFEDSMDKPVFAHASSVDQLLTQAASTTINEIMNLPEVEELRVDSINDSLVVYFRRTEDMQVVHPKVLDILRHHLFAGANDTAVEELVSCAVMRAFRARTADEWGIAGSIDGLAEAVSYHFELPPYWPWKDQQNCGIRVKAVVFAPKGSHLLPGANSGAPVLMNPDSTEPLLGEQILTLTDDALRQRGIIRQVIS